MKMTTEQRQKVEKVCTECGNKFTEKRESMMYECERCVGRHQD
ncbi:YhfH family protein [Sporosarcina sp. P13]|nr:YhfH family protein [Sporosarcina sp. P13]